MKHVKEILTAYADCNNLGYKDRDLNYFCTTPLTGAELEAIMPEAVNDGYNGFDSVKSVAEVIRFFGDHAEFHVAREGSVCIYVKPTKGNTWLSRDQKINCDEFLFDGTKGMFRVWWD